MGDSFWGAILQNEKADKIPFTYAPNDAMEITLIPSFRV